MPVSSDYVTTGFPEERPSALMLSEESLFGDAHRLILGQLLGPREKFVFDLGEGGRERGAAALPAVCHGGTGRQRSTRVGDGVCVCGGSNNCARQVKGRQFLLAAAALSLLL